MINIYSPGNTDFEKNGNATLNPMICDAEMNINGSWILNIDNPLDDRWKCIEEGAVVKCDTCIGKDQLFRIYEKSKTFTGVTAKAYPIFFDSRNDAFLMDVRPTGKTGGEALQIMCDNTPYSAESDITKVSTSYYVRKNLMEAINGNDENSFVKRWGGEAVYNNYHLIMNERCGGDYGARAEAGYNLTDIEETVNTEGVITRIIPESYNGHTLDGDEPWVDSPNIDKYPKIYTKVVQYSDVKLKEDCTADDDDGFETKEELDAELIKRAEEDFKNGCDVPQIAYKVNVANLENTVEYEDIKDLVKIGLGDNVRVYNKRIDIETNERAVKIVWDCISQKVKEVTLGNPTLNYFDKATSILQKADNAINDTDGTVKGNYVSGIISAMTARVRASASKATKQADKAILFEDLDPESDTFGAMALGTTGFCIAGKRTADGKDWEWSTFGTGKGFIADYIVAGTLALGGFKDNSCNILMYNEAGELIGKWNKTGFYSDNPIDNYGIKVNNGVVSIYGKDGKLTGVVRYNYDGHGIMISTVGDGENDETGVLNGKSDMLLGEDGEIIISGDSITLLPDSKIHLGGVGNNLEVGPDTGKSGKANFSDGTFLEFRNGILVGGNTKGGGF